MKKNAADRRINVLAAVVGAVLVAFLLVPLVQLCWVSPAAIVGLFAVPEVRDALVLTFSCAAIAAALGLFFSAALGYFLAQQPIWISRLLLPP